jgi:hypothetical protein
MSDNPYQSPQNERATAHTPYPWRYVRLTRTAVLLFLFLPPLLGVAFVIAMELIELIFSE